MSGSTQSFTLDDIERQRILRDGGLQQDNSGSLPPLSDERSSVMKVQPKSHLKAPDLPVFEYSYSQDFTQTQEDTSSFRKKIDSAPTIKRAKLSLENVFDDATDSQLLEPLAASTAMAESENIGLQPLSTDLDEPVMNVEINDQSGEMYEAITPAITRSKAQETPGGLTQMFQSSQDTPILRHRKSTYVSMKDSQQKKHYGITEEDSLEDDPDFPKIRRSSGTLDHIGAHSIMDRLRQRTLTDIETKADVQRRHDTVSSHRSASIASAENDSDTEASIIPASAPVQVEQHLTNLNEDETESIITDSQPPPLSVSAPLKALHQLPIAIQHETIQFDLPSSFPGSQIIDEDVTVPSCVLGITPRTERQRNTTHDMRASIVDVKLSRVNMATTEIASGNPMYDMQREFMPVAVQPLQTGHRQKPILLTETPINKPSKSSDFRTSTDQSSSLKNLRRSASYNLSSAKSLDLKDVDKSTVRSKSMNVKMSEEHAAVQILSSPVILAGHRRRSRKPMSISDSPLDVKFPEVPSKRARTQSPTSEFEPSRSMTSPPRLGRPRKIAKFIEEVHDSQKSRQAVNEITTPKQPTFQHLMSHDVRAAEPNVESLASRDTSEVDSTELIPSSPLTSLDSQDFLQESSAQVIEDSARHCARRVLTLHSLTDTYCPGIILDDTTAKATNFHESTVVSVQFDDTTEIDIELLHVRPLDLQIGDAVKINMPGLKTKQQIIVSLHRDVSDSTIYTDIHGHTSFEARRKDNGVITRYNVRQLYLPRNLMKPFFKRQFSTVHLDIPIEVPITPSRRQAIRTRDSSPALSLKGSQPNRMVGLFSNFAFSVSLSQNKAISRERLEKKIAVNGGFLLETGLDQIFEDSPFSEERDIAPLKLTSLGKSLKSAVVITDNPSRRAKYLQALSLGLPCLHYSYIDDCLAAKKLLEINSYLLAAGEARFGASTVTLSMSCPQHPPCHALTTGSLQHTIAHRRKIYANKSIIVVTGTAASVRASRKIHFFLSWAMGCADLTECVSLAEAHHLLHRPEDDKRWDLISVQDLPAAGSEEEQFMGDLSGRIVTNEDVVQSLITGKLCKSYF